MDTEEFETIFDGLPPKPERQAGIPRVVAPARTAGPPTGPSAPLPNPSAAAGLTTGRSEPGTSHEEGGTARARPSRVPAAR